MPLHTHDSTAPLRVRWIILAIGIAACEQPTAAPEPAPVATIAITPPSLSLAHAETQQLTATLRDAVGNLLTGRSMNWTSSAPAVAFVSATGLVTAVTEGNASVSATVGAITGSATVTVRPATVASVK